MRSSLLLLGLLTACALGPDPARAPDPDPASALRDTAPLDPDNDGDGWTASGDCDDNAWEVHPGATETCNGIDDDCDGLTDEDGATGGVTSYPDADGDGYGDVTGEWTSCEPPPGNVLNAFDCEDTRAEAYAGAPELCNDLDDNCNGFVDDGATGLETFYADADGDGFGNPELTETACSAPSGYVADANDCDDDRGAVNPDAVEVCNGIDDDCSGGIDDHATDLATWHADQDGDGYGAPDVTQTSCAAPSGYIADAQDCDDADPAVNPDGTEVCNGIDDDCDGTVDDSSSGLTTFYGDGDGDGHGDSDNTLNACSAPAGYVASADDCNDGDATVHPGAAEACNSVDDDCDGTVDGPSAQAHWYVDVDHDGYGNPDQFVLDGCQAPPNFVAAGTDCNDHAPQIHPGATEHPGDMADGDCDGVELCFVDLDGDGWRVDDTATVESPDLDCDAPGEATGWSNRGDCDDGNGAISPAATEVCNDVDDDCDHDVDESDAADAAAWYVDADLDGYGDDASVARACTAPGGTVGTGGDCDDGDVLFHPGATETCGDVVDYNCDGSTGFADEDGDGSPACEDCDDHDHEVSPDAVERCDGKDDDCDGSIDEDGATGSLVWYPDADGDGYGVDALAVQACQPPAGHTGVAGDCDDDDTGFHPGASETDCTDPSDYNCDGSSGLDDLDADGVPACEDCDDGDGDRAPGVDERCNDVDDDCDGTVDEPDAIDAIAWHPDVDGDGFGDEDTTTTACAAPADWTRDDQDCDDADDGVSPGATELCTDLFDRDCDGVVTGADADGDGVVDCLDCADDDSTAFPGATETCDGVDDDCDGTVDEDAVDSSTWYADADDDGAVDPESPFVACVAPDGFAARVDDDCDDGDDGVYPGATDVPCDGVDQDCADGDAQDGDGCVQVDTDTGVGDTEVGDTEVAVDSDTTGGDTGTGKDEPTACNGESGCDSSRGATGLTLLPLLVALVRRRRR